MTPEKVAAYAAVGGLLMTLIGSVLGYILHLRDSAQADAIGRLETASKASFAAIDRLKEERALYLTKIEGEKLRYEIKSDIKELGERLIGEIDRLLQVRKL